MNEEEAKLYHQDLEKLFELSVDALCVTNNTEILFANPAFTAGLGYTLDELRDKSFLDMIHPEDRARTMEEVSGLFRGETTLLFENRCVTSTGESRWFQWSARAQEGTGRIYACGRDITNQHQANEKLQRYTDLLERTQGELKEALDELNRIASTDQLTGLLNRRGFESRAYEELSRSERYRRPVGLALFDIDRFKLINDEHGHPMGDVVLREVSRRLETGSRHHDVVARWGGEEFAVLLPETPLDEALIAAERIALSVATRPILIGSAAVNVRVSGGVAAALGEEVESLHQLLSIADTALLSAKNNGRDRIETGELVPRRLAS